jgi:hypothetical protein
VRDVWLRRQEGVVAICRDCGSGAAMTLGESLQLEGARKDPPAEDVAEGSWVWSNLNIRLT